MIMTAAAVPLYQSTLARLRVRSAVTSVSGAIQSTRYQAISNGYQFKVAFDKANHAYQVSSDPNSTGAFSNVGGPVPFTSAQVDLGSDATVLLSPSGRVSFVAGGSPLVLTLNNNIGTLAVSPYGNVNVTYKP
jgi:hypothetical protein